MNEQYELYYNDGHGWQPSNLGRFDTRDGAEDAKGSWTDGFTRANGAAPQVRVDRAGVLRFGAGAVAPGELADTDPPRAVFIGIQSNPFGEDFPLFNVIGGEKHEHTVTRETLERMGIEVPNTEGAE